MVHLQYWQWRTLQQLIIQQEHVYQQQVKVQYVHQQKLKVLVNIFERQVPVELSFDQVKKLD